MGQMASGGFDLASMPALGTLLGLLGFTPEQQQAINQAKDTIQQITAFIQAFTKGANDGLLKEPSRTATDNAASAVQAVLAGLPDRQHLTAEMAQFTTGAAGLQPVLAALTGMGQGAWQHLNGGFAQLTDTLDRIGKTVDQAGTAIGQLVQQGSAALSAALATQGKTPADLADPDLLAELAGTLVVDPVPGLNDEPVLLREFLNRLLSQLPVVPVPVRETSVSGDLITETTNTEAETLPDGTTFSVNRTTQVSAPAASTSSDLVPSNLSTPPLVNLVDANQFRTDPNPFKPQGNPVTAVENALALAADLQAASEQQRAVAASSGDIAEGAQALSVEDGAEALRLAIRAIIKGLITYNFQTGITPTATNTMGHAQRWWSQFVPPLPALPVAVAQKIAAGQELNPAEQAAYDAAMASLSASATAITNRPFGSLPGTLVYAAIADDFYAGTLDDLIDDMPSLIAAREGLPSPVIANLTAIISNLDRPDSDVEQIPNLFTEGDPRITDAALAVQRWVNMLIYTRDLSAATVSALSIRVGQFSGAVMDFVAEVRSMSVVLDDLYTRLLRDTITYADRVIIQDLANFWDQIVVTEQITPGSQDPVVVTYLTEFLAAQALLPPATSMLEALTDVKEAVYELGGPLGSDLHQLVGVLGALLRSERVLLAALTDGEKESRVQDLFTSAELMAGRVPLFPNPGMFARMAEVLV